MSKSKWVTVARDGLADEVSKLETQVRACRTDQDAAEAHAALQRVKRLLAADRGEN